MGMSVSVYVVTVSIVMFVVLIVQVKLRLRKTLERNSVLEDELMLANQEVCDVCM